MADIFIRRLFIKRGPYTEEELRTWLREGKLSPRTRAWRQGMTEWKPLSAWELMSPSASLQRRFQPGRRRDYDRCVATEPGYGRLKYVLMSLLLQALILGGLFVIATYASGIDRMLPDLISKGTFSEAHFSPSSLLSIVLMVSCALWLGMKRLENIGWHWAWVLLTLVPVLNILMAFAMIALPPGYAATKKLDFIAWLWISLLALLIGFVLSGSLAPVILEKAGDFIDRHIPAPAAS